MNGFSFSQFSPFTLSYPLPKPLTTKAISFCFLPEVCENTDMSAPSTEHGKGRREPEKQGGGRSSGVKRKLERMRREGVWGTVLLLVSNSTHAFFFFSRSRHYFLYIIKPTPALAQCIDFYPSRG